MRFHGAFEWVPSLSSGLSLQGKPGGSQALVYTEKALQEATRWLNRRVHCRCCCVCVCVYEHLGGFLDVFWHAQLFQTMFFKTKPPHLHNKQRCVSQSAEFAINKKKLFLKKDVSKCFHCTNTFFSVFHYTVGKHGLVCVLMGLGLFELQNKLHINGVRELLKFLKCVYWH